MKKILLYVSDGISLGHLQRISQIGKTIKKENKDIKITLITSSLKPFVFGKFFDDCVQIVPLSDKLLEDPSEETRVENADLVLSVFKKFKPDLVVADFLLASRFTFYPLKYALDNFPTKSVFIWRLGEIKNLSGDLKKEKEKLDYFEKVFLPYDKKEIGEVENILPLNFEIVGPVFREINKDKVNECVKKYKISQKDFLLTIVLGGGGELKVGKCESPDKIIDSFSENLVKLKKKISNLKVIICTGPYYDKKNINHIRLKKDWIKIIDFEENILELISISGLVVSPAGYNICQEIIMAKTPAVLVPLWRKNREQFERAEYLKTKGVVEVLENDSSLDSLDLVMKSYNNIDKMKNGFKNFSRLKSGNKKIVKKVLKILD